MATVKSKKADVSTDGPSSERLTKGYRSKHQLFYSLRWPIFVFNSVVYTNLPAILFDRSSTPFNENTFGGFFIFLWQSEVNYITQIYLITLGTRVLNAIVWNASKSLPFHANSFLDLLFSSFLPLQSEGNFTTYRKKMNLFSPSYVTGNKSINYQFKCTV